MPVDKLSLPAITRRPRHTPDWPDVPPLLARILAGRGVDDPAQLDLALKRLPHPSSFTGLRGAVELLLQGRSDHWRICIVGDYDADGATATTLMVRGLELLGFPRPEFLVPDRFEYGYGLSPAIVELAQQQYQPDLIITVDNGIASVDGVAAARARGIKVLITDHHLPGDTLPDADALVNPRLPGCEDFPAANRPIIRALRLPRQLAITGSENGLEPTLAHLQEGLSAARPPLVLLRAPALRPPAYRELAANALPVCEKARAALIVHGGPEVFRAIPGARGLHLPWREANKLSARPVPEDVWLGVSCHDRQEIDHATAIGADYVTLGPVQPTESHPGAPTLGWSVFADLVSEAVLPVFALGGLSPGDLREARQRGGQGIAGIRFWWPQS